MKKYLPFIILLAGLLVVGGVYFLIKGDSSDEGEEKQLVELQLSEKPYITLVPESDGHWLNLTVDKLETLVSNYNAESMDYELVYTAESGTQGVPGTIKLSGVKVIERRLLLGSESSGKYRYDEGINGGKLTFSFRDDSGKLITRLSTEFSMFEGEGEINVPGSGVTYTSETEDAYYIAVDPLGLPAEAPQEGSEGPVGVFSSSEEFNFANLKGYPGTAYLWEGEWKEMSENTGDFGIYIFVK